MTPFQTLAAFDGVAGRPRHPGWARTAPVLRPWAAQERVAAITEEEQAGAICAHIVRVWAPPVLDRCPALASHAAALRAAPCAGDWSEALRRGKAAYGDAWPAAARGFTLAAWNAAYNATRDAARDAAWAATWDAACDAPIGTAWNAADHAVNTTVYAATLEPDPAAAFDRAAEEWIALAAPAAPALAPLRERAPGLLNFTREPADADAYAVAWDILGADLPTWDTDDGRRVRDGVDADGATVPAWARRTALARCLVRMEIPR